MSFSTVNALCRNAMSIVKDRIFSAIRAIVTMGALAFLWLWAAGVFSLTVDLTYGVTFGALALLITQLSSLAYSNFSLCRMYQNISLMLQSCSPSFVKEMPLFQVLPKLSNYSTDASAIFAAGDGWTYFTKTLSGYDTVRIFHMKCTGKRRLLSSCCFTSLGRSSFIFLPRCDSTMSVASEFTSLHEVGHASLQNHYFRTILVAFTSSLCVVFSGFAQVPKVGTTQIAATTLFGICVGVMLLKMRRANADEIAADLFAANMMSRESNAKVKSMLDLGALRLTDAQGRYCDSRVNALKSIVRELADPRTSFQESAKFFLGSKASGFPKTPARFWFDHVLDSNLAMLCGLVIALLVLMAPPPSLVVIAVAIVIISSFCVIFWWKAFRAEFELATRISFLGAPPLWRKFPLLTQSNPQVKLPWPP